MKGLTKTLAVLWGVLFFISTLEAQSLKGMSLNGAAGLYTIPTARVGWDQNADIGIDLGYHAILNESQMAHIPTLGLSFFKWLEISAALDIQPEYIDQYKHNDDLLLGLKIQLPRNLIGGGTSLAFGGNFQFHNLGDGSVPSPADNRLGSENTSFQIYGVVSYAGEFFNMPAETTVFLGKSIIIHDAVFFDKAGENKNVDFGMGFDLALLPKVFQNYIHLIIDFSNYGYSALPYPAAIIRRGILSAGLRIDLSVIPPLRRFKFSVDILGMDLLDESRAFSFGLVFGIPVK